MTFRELLDKYRAGQTSEEERALVEAELEKSEAIADYLAEQVEDALGAAETQAPAGEVRHIQKKVNRRLRRTAVWAACIVLAVLLGVRFVVSPLVSSLYYQPNAYTVGGMEDRAPDSLVEENGVEVIGIGDLPPEEVERHLRVESQDVAVDLTALYSLIAPGTTVTDSEKRPDYVLESFRRMGALPKLNTAEKIAPAVLFLSSSDSDGITGETLVVDGGGVQIRMPEKLYEEPMTDWKR